MRLGQLGEKRVAVARDLADDVALVVDGLLDAVDRAPANLGADGLGIAPAGLEVGGLELLLTEQRAELPAPAPDVLRRFADRGARVLLDVLEEGCALLLGDVRVVLVAGSLGHDQ